MLNTAVLKSVGFWIAVLGAVLGVALSQHLIVDGSTAGDIVGWLLTVIGAGGAGHQVAGAPKAELPGA